MRLYCIVYRTGGTENFRWHRSLAMSQAEAVKAQADTERMGYPALLVDYRLSLAIGLPDTFSV